MDKFYKHIKSKELLEQAGWFDDGLTKDKRESLYSLDMFTTPIHKLIKKEKPVVLITTGGFSPIHQGHVSMMKEAKETLERAGYGVCGGYFSPSHDSYVLNKHNNTDTIEKRVNSIEKEISDCDWLMTDLWESTYTPKAINFTDVIIRLERYLKKWFSKEVQVVYVFGSDNQFFLEAFRHEGLAVCIKRSEELNSEMRSLVDNKKRFFIKPKSDLSEFSSRKINYKEKTKQGYYLVRDDLKLSLGTNSGAAKNVFKKYFKNLKFLPGKYDIDFTNKTISLDVWNKGDYQLEVSRDFFLSDPQIKGIKLNNRIGSKNLTEQIKDIPEGEYILFDDDIASGQTMSLIKKLLPKNIEVIDEKSLVGEYLPDNNFLDIVDLRDFFFGSKHGGLNIILPNGKRGRVPYLIPYVNLSTRASMKLRSAIDFSIEILKLNLKISSNLIIENLPEEQQEFFYFLGYKKTSSLRECLVKHINFLENIYK